MYIDQIMIFGKKLDIYEAIKFLNKERKDERGLIIRGTEGSGFKEVAKFSVKYVMNRTTSYESAYYVDASFAS